MSKIDIYVCLYASSISFIQISVEATKEHNAAAGKPQPQGSDWDWGKPAAVHRSQAQHLLRINDLKNVANKKRLAAKLMPKKNKALAGELPDFMS
jgi:hypothetical protein